MSEIKSKRITKKEIRKKFPIQCGKCKSRNVDGSVELDYGYIYIKFKCNECDNKLTKKVEQ